MNLFVEPITVRFVKTAIPLASEGREIAFYK